MTKSNRVMRRMILTKLVDHLRERYAEFPGDEMVEGDLSLHDLDALLAFKGDPELEELRNALVRLENGTYGICLSCKGPISQEVLDNDPTQRVCSMCEQKFIATVHHGHMHQPVAP